VSHQGETRRLRPSAHNGLRLSRAQWQAILDNPQTADRYYDRVYHRPDGSDGCWFWLGALSSTGHGRLRVSRSVGNYVVPAHLFGFQRAKGLLVLGSDGKLPVIRHRCDEASCCRPSHWLAGSIRENAQDYIARKDNPASPLRDRRGPARRARAIRAAIRSAQCAGASPEQIELAIELAIEAGMPAIQGSLF
jgi:hypothetical protein